ncbi:recombinase family protein [Nitratireductor sp. StC3]|uniref:recombinase family protein n=1 Tax=Nitratireductor sp. StC3 TaxID=2126741 RepID=UPI000D0E0C39|nr:recombinase family protein [Nitratireductor sp. StC3]PSM19846.1 recombinase [Nitratireductor sp. StC3]
MIYGYARVSTESQDLEVQIGRLRQAGCERIYCEKRSGADANRPQLQRMLSALRTGDIVLAVVTDRLARDPFDMLDILRRITAKGAGLKLLDEPFIDTTSEMSDLILFVVGWAAKWHRRRILENTAAGRARARALGIKFGRKPKLNDIQRRDALARLAAGEPRKTVASDYRVSRSTIGRLSR